MGRLWQASCLGSIQVESHFLVPKQRSSWGFPFNPLNVNTFRRGSEDSPTALPVESHFERSSKLALRPSRGGCFPLPCVHTESQSHSEGTFFRVSL